MWVSTDAQAVLENVEEELSLAFNRLFDYISGENDRGERREGFKIAMAN